MIHYQKSIYVPYNLPKFVRQDLKYYIIGHVKYLQTGSSFYHFRLPKYHKKNHLISPVLIQYVDNEQELKDRKIINTKFLKRHIYDYFYNNLRIDKAEKLTREELNNYYLEECVKCTTEYQWKKSVLDVVHL